MIAGHSSSKTAALFRDRHECVILECIPQVWLMGGAEMPMRSGGGGQEEWYSIWSQRWFAGQPAVVFPLPGAVGVGKAGCMQAATYIYMSDSALHGCALGLFARATHSSSFAERISSSIVGTRLLVCPFCLSSHCSSLPSSLPHISSALSASLLCSAQFLLFCVSLFLTCCYSVFSPPCSH